MTAPILANSRVYFLASVKYAYTLVLNIYKYTILF